ncbi:MAG: hypothetical protein AAGB04_08480 [Pseudomonadota bacterium]
MEDFDNEEVWSNDRYLLQERYMELTRVLLPAEARLRTWSLQNDHCFMRVILDHLFQDCWYRHLDRRLTAYKQLNVEQLQQCITLAERILEQGDPLLTNLNRQSLAWRRKRNDLTSNEEGVK